MSQSIIPYLIINYPDPTSFLGCLEVILSANPDYLEIQLPFSNPVVDGPIIQRADQIALQFPLDLAEILSQIGDLKVRLGSTTKLILMSYITPAFAFGITDLAQSLAQNGFYGAIIPDLPVDAPEFGEFQNAGEVCLIPVISPITTQDRLTHIQNFLKPNQMVYITARKGLTGSQTDLSHPEFLDYAEFIKSNLTTNVLALGFGIRTNEQLTQARNLGFVPVVATELISRIATAIKSESKTDQNFDQKKLATEAVVDWLGEIMV